MKKLIFVMAMAAAGAAAAGVSFSYQGALRTAEGGPIPVDERNKTIAFRLYDTPTGEGALWGRKIAVYLDDAGLFNVELSDLTGNALADVMTNNLDWVLADYLGKGKSLYIGLDIEGSTGEIRPRQKLLNVPAAAFAADVAEAKNDFTVNGIATFRGAVNADVMTVSKGLTVLSGGLTVSSGGLTVGGTSGTIVPRGGIIMWSGTANAIPNGWALCDGDNGTPDLRGRFIVGASGMAGGMGTGVDVAYTAGDTGGTNSVTLTIEQMPSHEHSFNRGRATNLSSSGSGTDIWARNGVYDSSATTTSTGGHAAHENRPPYYALCFIMKL